MVGYLKNIFPDVPILAFMATNIPSVLEYIRKLLKLRLSTQLYRELLDEPNITYMVDEITKPKYEDLAYFIPDNDGADAIPLIMIFVDDSEDA